MMGIDAAKITEWRAHLVKHKDQRLLGTVMVPDPDGRPDDFIERPMVEVVLEADQAALHEALKEVVQLRAEVRRFIELDTSGYAEEGRAAFLIMDPETPCRISLSARVAELVDEKGAAQLALSMLVYARDNRLYLLGDVEEEDPEGNGRRLVTGALNYKAITDIEFAIKAHRALVAELSEAEADAGQARDDARGFQGERNIAQGNLDDTRAELSTARGLLEDALPLTRGFLERTGQCRHDQPAVRVVRRIVAFLKGEAVEPKATEPARFFALLYVYEGKISGVQGVTRTGPDGVHDFEGEPDEGGSPIAEITYQEHRDWCRTNDDRPLLRALSTELRSQVEPSALGDDNA